MPVEIIVPPLSQTMDSLVLVSWLKIIGEEVAKGEPLFTVETDKATLEVEAPGSGILQELLAQPGDEIKVRSVIGYISGLGEESRKDDRFDASVTRSSDVTAQAGNVEAIRPSSARPLLESQQRLFATPRARHVAQSESLDLEVLREHGSGPQGWIIARDVLAYVEKNPHGYQQQLPAVKATPLARRVAIEAGIDLTSVSPSQPGAPLRKADIEAAILSDAGTASPSIQRVSLSPTRRTIARRLSESHASVVSVTYMTEVDATRLVKMRRRILEELPDGTSRPTITDFLIWITCHALISHLELNATFDGDVLEISKVVDISLAVDTNRGLLVPVLRHVEEMGLGELARQREALVRRTLAGQVTPDELSGGTFTLTNLGTLGIDHFTPVINPPQVAILGVGRLRSVPIARKKKVKIRQVLGLALTCDHRVIDGAPAARFLQDIAAGIEKPHLVFSK